MGEGEIVSTAPIGVSHPGYDRAYMPGPLDYFTNTVDRKFRERRGKWRTTSCAWCGSSAAQHKIIVNRSHDGEVLLPEGHCTRHFAELADTERLLTRRPRGAA